MIRSASERAELDQELGSIKPFFWDRKLRYNKEYRRFFDELDHRGWVTFLIASLAYALASSLLASACAPFRRPPHHRPGNYYF